MPNSSDTQLETESNQVQTGYALCDVCNFPPGASSHDASVAHQICLKHSYPPSNLDRSRRGLKYLASFGWDPDSRLGLGAAGSGIRAPIKTKEKNDTVGLGVLPTQRRRIAKQPLQRLDAKQSRTADKENLKRREELRELFYCDQNVTKYMGAGG